VGQALLPVLFLCGTVKETWTGKSVPVLLERRATFCAEADSHLGGGQTLLFGTAAGIAGRFAGLLKYTSPG